MKLAVDGGEMLKPTGAAFLFLLLFNFYRFAQTKKKAGELPCI